jgi:hypothetical protein
MWMCVPRTECLNSFQNDFASFPDAHDIASRGAAATLIGRAS